MKPLTISINYYNQAEFLAELVLLWSEFPRELLDQARFVVIDDGSSRPAVDALGRVPPQLDLQVYRILPDIPFNFAGTANLAAAVATTPWIMRHDLDHVLSPELLRRGLELARPENCDVLFRCRIRFSDGRIAPASSAHLMTLDWFWMLGGYDEDFSGEYGFDDTEFHTRAARSPGLSILDSGLEFVADGRGASEIRRDYCRNEQLFHRKRAAATGPGQVLRFPWRRVV
jgi:hypothetical protein